MDYLQQSFSVRFEYKVFFTEHLFNRTNPAFKDFLNSQRTDTIKKILFVIDEGVSENHPVLQNNIREYFTGIDGFTLIDKFIIIEGGENAKNSEMLFHSLVDAVDKYGIDRHSYIAAIGGGSILDLVGYASAVSHRGIRHIRIPTTVLSQNDSGVGVKNGINYLLKKNFLGTFVPPVAVFNDYHFLTTLSDEEWRSGISEAVKVSLIRDAEFFAWIERHMDDLATFERSAMAYMIRRCAELHMRQISQGGDPFES